MTKEPQTPAVKKIEVTLTATTCVQYTEIVEVPADISEEELNNLVNTMYETVAADEYENVCETWERGSCGAVAAQTDAPASSAAVRVASRMELHAIEGLAQPTV